jgi:hypothetical protein
VRRFQYTAIDDVTHVRALKVYERHTQKNAIDFVGRMIRKFPFRINATSQNARGDASLQCANSRRRRKPPIQAYSQLQSN